MNGRVEKAGAAERLQRTVDQRGAGAWAWVVPMAIAAMVALIAWGGPSHAQTGPVTGTLAPSDQTVQDVTARDNYFEPSAITITVGSVVRWRNLGSNLHTTTSDAGYWNWTLVPGAQYNVRFLSPGVYDYHCVYHRAEGMTGSVHVVSGPGPSPTPTVPVGPTLPPPMGGGSIVFDYFADEATRSRTDLFTVRPDGSERNALTTTAELSEAQPSWSPDQSQVVYTASTVEPQGAPWALWIVDTATGDRRQLTSGPEHYEPEWSPMGSAIVFTDIRRIAGTVVRSEIAVVAPDGTGRRTLVAVNSTNYGVINPTWSPDGQRIAFTLSSNSVGGELWVMNADGTNARRLFVHTGWDDIDPTWSPDGRYIAFASGVHRGTQTLHDIWLVDVMSGAVGTVAQHPTWELRRPAWSPDGSEIIFSARFEDSPPRWALYLVPATGGPISGPVTLGAEPDWAGGSLLPTPPVPPTATATPQQTPTIPPFPTLPTPMPTQPGATATMPPPPTFPPPEPTPTDGLPSPSPSATAPTATTTATPSPSPTRDGATPIRIYLSLALRGVPVR